MCILLYVGKARGVYIVFLMSITGGPFWAVFMNINDVLIFETGDKSAEDYARIARFGAGRAEILSVRVYRCDKNGVSPV